MHVIQKGGTHMQTKQLTRNAFFVILYIIGSKLIIPLGIIPFTLQTMVFYLAGMLLRPKDILLSFSMYLFMGLCGLPVFASGGGIAYIMQPSFGFLLAFPIAAALVSYVRLRFYFTTIWLLLPVCFAGLFLIYTIGCTYMYGILNYYTGIQKDMASIIAIGALPFIITDSFSILLSSIIALRLSHISTIKRFIQDTH